MQANASTNAHRDYLGDGGPNKLKSPVHDIVNAVNTSNDTIMVEVPLDGTVADGGPNA